MARVKKTEPQGRKITPKVTKPKEDRTPIYRAVCHTKCFWLNTLWEPNDVYEGPEKPIKHFSKDGTNPNKDPNVMAAGDDPRSTNEMLTVLKNKFGVEPPLDEDGFPAKRHDVFNLLRKHELIAQGAGGIKAKE